MCKNKMKNLPRKTDFIFIKHLINTKMSIMTKDGALSPLMKIYGEPYHFFVHYPQDSWTGQAKYFLDNKKTITRVCSMDIPECYWCNHDFMVSGRIAVHCIIQREPDLWVKKILICQEDLWKLISSEIDPEAKDSPYFKIEICPEKDTNEYLHVPTSLELFVDENPYTLKTDYILRDIFVYDKPLIPPTQAPTSEQIKEFIF